MSDGGDSKDDPGAVARKTAPTEVVVLVALSLGLVACGSPYVFTKDEFDRESDTFGERPVDRDFVTICYSHWESTPEQALEIAEGECAKYGKTARFADQRFYRCPLNTPVEATFACTGG